MTLRVGVNNVADEPPPMAASSWTDSNADTSTYNALGRVMYVSANYKF
jgi:outer membrane receptor protein involved in Fe transport